MKSEIEKIEKRPIRYWYEDGLNEMAFGVIGISLGVYFWIHTRIPPGSAWHIPWALGMFPLLLFGSRLLQGIVKRLKEKWTYPRTGYVSYRRSEGGRRRIAIRGAVVGAAFGLAIGFLRSSIFQQRFGIAMVVLITGLIGAGVLMWIEVKTGVFRYFVMSMISALAGIGLSTSGLAEMAALGLFWGILGASHGISGVFVLVRYLRRHPAGGADPS